MDLEQAEQVCALRFPVKSDAYWQCVETEHCGAEPSAICQGRVWIERVINPNPAGDERGLDRLSQAVLGEARRLAADLARPGARVSASATLRVVEALQAAGYHQLALEGTQLITQIEGGRAAPRAELMGNVLEARAVSLEALGNIAAARDSRTLGALMRRSIIR